MILQRVFVGYSVLPVYLSIKNKNLGLDILYHSKEISVCHVGNDVEISCLIFLDVSISNINIVSF